MSKPKKSNPATNLDNFLDKLSARIQDFTEHPERVEEEMNKVGGNPITLGPRVTDPASWASDQISAAKNKATKWLERSKRPKKVPSQAALEANEKRIERLQQSLTDKTWESAMANVDEDLRLQVLDKGGAAAFSSGIDRHSVKVDAKVKKLQPLVLALAQTLDGMPTGTDADREAKMIAAKRGMQEIGKKMKGK
jgi:hypothetical protein